MIGRASRQDRERQEQNYDSDGHIDEEDRVPIKTSAQIAAYSGTEGRNQDHGNTNDRYDFAALVGWEYAEDDRKGQWDQCTAANSLQDTKCDQRLLCRGERTQQRSSGKQSQSCQKDLL